MQETDWHGNKATALHYTQVGLIHDPATIMGFMCSQYTVLYCQLTVCSIQVLFVVGCTKSPQSEAGWNFYYGGIPFLYEFYIGFYDISLIRG